MAFDRPAGLDAPGRIDRPDRQSRVLPQRPVTIERRPLMETKSFLASKTLWVNAIALAAALLAAFGVVDLDAEVQASLVGGIMAVVNIVLRVVTKHPVS